ncbi:NAD-dependent epimerase/dehydratase family protein [Costertonia aggregata]|uniref:NAD-dependent epimerase/dehydratase family protein n=1 Tax=Costertonia aggregata TaxID=343403 RepID=A0A7H9AQG1_9FLAO|nr:NAD-dependent epimerase/dehydratase family protein [Costertonia aggregata]QLG45688.1 NAD-dependent epimerase/dehydratase family protein [Costertonia aggregata]
MVLVTGGTGLVGAHLLLELVQKNTCIRAIRRATSNLKNVEKVFSYYVEDAPELFQKIEWVTADLNNIPELENAFRNVTHVYHCAALISFDPNNYGLLSKINTEGTANIVNLCIANNIKKIGYVSSIATLGKHPETMHVDEETEWNPQNANAYALTKYDAEMEVWRGTMENVPAIIVNPGVILGPGFWNSGSGILFTTVAKNRAYYPPGGTGFVTVNDVVKIMVRLMDSDIQNERFIAVGENLTFKKILADIAKTMNLKPPTKELKIWQLEILWRLDWLKNLLTGSDRKLTKNNVRSLRQQSIFETTKIEKMMDYTFEPLGDALQFCSKKFMEENG